jgi:hypothetical protein
MESPTAIVEVGEPLPKEGLVELDPVQDVPPESLKRKEKQLSVANLPPEVIEQ